MISFCLSTCCLQFPGRWITSDYSPCSKTCGTGSATRHVYCVRPLPDSDAFKRTPDSLCKKPKPETRKTCNPQPCPIWFAGAWSPVGRVAPARGAATLHMQFYNISYRWGAPGMFVIRDLQNYFLVKRERPSHVIRDQEL